jgi:hypothetical protein
VNFIHPEKGQRVNRTLIGLEEGAAAFPFPASLSRQNNTAWYEDVNNGNDIEIHYSPTRGSILIEADNDGGIDGTFYKRVHLLD